MRNITNFKKIINVFQVYGIPLTGQRKSADFYSGLRMDKIFVEGLIWELEYSLNRELDDHQIAKVKTPRQLIDYLVTD